MYQFSYAEVQQDDIAEAKDRERQLLDRSIELLLAAKGNGAQSSAGLHALFLTRRIWTRFIEDLGSSDNELDTELRANLISVGIWILKECERIREGKSDNFEGVAEISGIIRDGLK